MIQTGFFTHEIQLRRLDELGDPLKAVSEAIDFEIFRPTLATLLGVHTGVVGRKPWDQVLMFKILVLQVIRGLSDEMLEFQLHDSASAQRFIGRSPHDTMPDSTSVWLFRDTLAKSRFPPSAGEPGTPGKETDGVRALFDVLHRELAAKGLLCREGKTVDAMIVEVPRQRNTREENKLVKSGEIPEAWKKQPRKLAQKDTDASWTQKRGQNHFGYKNSIVGGNSDCFVHDYVVSAAHPHDSQIVPGAYYEAAGGEEPVAFGDSAYGGPDIAERLRANGITPLIHEKGTRGHPLGELQIEMNHLKSRVRAKIEHRFGRMTMCIKRLALRCLGITRATGEIGMINLVHNIMEYGRLKKTGATPA
jgi:transposase, IS5 family